jgi:GMP synthase-like glutamine amidotransferase
MRIGVLQVERFQGALLDAVGPHLGLYEQLLTGHGFAYDLYDVLAMQMPAAADAVDGWLITGSAAAAYDDLPWIAPLQQFIRQIHDQRRPLVGICFGHQIIAQVLGGRVEKFAGGWSIGRQPYVIDGQPVHLNAWHRDQVTALPPEAQVFGQSDFCRYAALTYGDHILTLQAHPEYGATMLRALIDHYADDQYPPDRIARALADLPRPTDEAAIATRIARHFTAAFTPRKLA